MKHKLILILGTALLATISGLAQDEIGKHACRLDGSWIGSAPAWGMNYLLSYHSDSPWNGSGQIRWIGGDPTFGGLFPTAESYSTGVITWERTGRRNFVFSTITYALDAQGQPVYITKNSGHVELSQGCDDSEYFDGAMSVYGPTQDPFGVDPPMYGCIPVPDGGTARRVVVNPPCEENP